MYLLLAGLALIVTGGSLALLLRPFPRFAGIVGASSVVLGSVLGIVPAVQTLLAGESEALRWPWHVPYGEFQIAIDALSAYFLIPIFGLSIMASVYGVSYLRRYEGRRSLGSHWFFFNGLIASMVLVVVARNGILFMVAWEMMAIASFFLVTFEHEKAEVRSAGLTYLVATHLGTAFLLVMFAILGREAGSLDFDRFGALEMLAPATASIIFVSAVVGFGAKAGFVPMHVWLPEAHPAAPSHVSALMSGVMIKIGIYGILRALTFLDSPPVWWGVMLIGIGITSGVFGVVFALAQRDLKRLLAYSSVENIGIITLGMGVGLLAVSRNMDTVAVLAFAGSALHVMNHAAFKGLLFLGAGSVLHATEQRDMDRQGGLIKRMPITGFTFLVSAAAIAGLPPLNGFVSEFLIFLGALNGSLNNDVITSVSLIGVIAGLGLIGGLAVACFTRAFGIVFLGTPRTDAATHAHEGGPGFRIPMLVLAAVCVLIGVFPLVSMRIVAPVASQISGVPVEAAESLLTGSASPLIMVTIAAFVVIGFSALLVLLRTALLARKEVGASVTWDCGYELPTARMQYTSSSFAQPLLRIFRQLLGIRVRLHAAEGYFPARASFYSDAPDVFTDRMYQPAVVMLEWVSLKLRWFQHGRVHIYLLYIFVTLLVLMIWKLGF